MLSASGTLDSSDYARLLAEQESRRQAASEAGTELEPFASGVYGPDGEELACMGYGRHRYPLLLQSRCVSLQVRANGGKSGTSAVVEFRSEWLWSGDGVEERLATAEGWAVTWLNCTPDQLKVSRCDLAQDIAGDVMTAVQAAGTSFVKPTGLRPNWVGEFGAWSAVTFGTHGSPVQVQVYDKRAEICERSGKAWLEEIWSRGGWDGSAPVFRHESRFNREFLHTCRWTDRATGEVRTGVDTLGELCAALPDLHAYAVEHVRHVEASHDAEGHTRSRAQLSPVWRVIAAPWLGVAGFKRARSWRVVGDREQLRRVLVGLTTSLYALSPGWERLSLANVCDLVAAEVRVVLVDDSLTRAELARKRLRYECAA